MDAFDKKLLNCHQVELVRRVIIERSRYGKKLNRKKGSTTDKNYTVSQLQSDITRITKDKERFVHQAEIKETRLIRMLSAVRRHREDPSFTALLEEHDLERMPELQGSYAV
jgi:septal ring factor EnvC (AmiA/AmiB activator)